MSDSDGLGGSSSSNGGGVISDGGGTGAGHTTLSGAVEQADKAIRDMASAVIFGGDIDLDFFSNDLRRLADGLDALNKFCLHHSARKRESAYLGSDGFISLEALLRPHRLDVPGAFHPAKAENGDSQQSDGSDAC